MNQALWVLVTSTVEAFIYEVKPEGFEKKFELIYRFTDEKGRLKSHELASHSQGHFAGSGGARGKFEPKSDPQENEHKLFVHEIVKFLDDERKHNAFGHLIICAESHCYGLIEKHIPKELQAMLKKHVLKDYIPLPEDKRLQALHAVVHEPL